MTYELDALYAARKRLCRIAALAAVADPGLAADAMGRTHPAGQLLALSIGPFGPDMAQGRTHGFDWAGYLPGPDQVLSTWSDYADARGVCVVEGDFYGPAWGHRPAIGRDPDLARLVLEHVLAKGPEAVRELDGLFSGWVYSPQDQRLWLFVDPTGARLLYYRAEAGRCEVASSLYAFAGGTTPPQLDPLSLNEHLVFGGPLESRTLLAGVRLVPPGKVVEWDRTGVREHRYFRFPERRRRMAPAEVGESIASALERQVKYLDLGRLPWTMGLSGGKDCRVILSALLHENIRPVTLTFSTSETDMDALLGVRIASAVGLESHLIRLGSPLSLAPEAVALGCDAALLSDGYDPGYSMQTLAACASQYGRTLTCGFTGDTISGLWAGVQPWCVSTADDLASMVLRMQGHLVPPGLLARVLVKELRVSEETLLEHWRAVYREAFAEFGDPVTAHIATRLAEYNRRCGASFYHGMRTAITIVQAYSGRLALRAYLEMPVAYLAGQKGHIQAAIHRFPVLGDIPSHLTDRIPLRYEYHARYGFNIYRAVRRLMRRLRPKPAAPPSGPAALSPRSEQFLDAVLNSEIFDPAAIRGEVLPAAAAGDYKAFHKMAATAIHAEFAVRRKLLFAPFFLALDAPGRARLSSDGKAAS